MSFVAFWRENFRPPDIPLPFALVLFPLGELRRTDKTKQCGRLCTCFTQIKEGSYGLTRRSYGRPAEKHYQEIILLSLPALHTNKKGIFTNFSASER